MPRKKLTGLALVDDGTDARGRNKKAVTRDGRDFKPSARRLGFFQNPNGTWLETEDWPGYDTLLICRTPGCHMEGVEVEGGVNENVDGVYRACCGPCGQPITEIWVDEAVQVMPLDPPTNFVAPKMTRK